jgi:hypothetical protein
MREDGWVLVIDHDGLCEENVNDPSGLLMRRLQISKEEAENQMEEAYKSQIGIFLPETAKEYSGWLVPPDNEENEHA